MNTVPVVYILLLCDHVSPYENVRCHSPGDHDVEEILKDLTSTATQSYINKRSCFIAYFPHFEKNKRRLVRSLCCLCIRLCLPISLCIPLNIYGYKARKITLLSVCVFPLICIKRLMRSP
jgi:hypothetical protein